MTLHANRPATHPVHLVGAGPGDPELLTLKAARCIAQASVIFVDDLVHPEVLAHASPQARIVAVGKRGGRPSTEQTLIHRQMVHAARAGERVVRLKGGDPGIFGRSGEEAQALRDAGLTVEVVPGITAAQAAAQALGVPLTHRDAAQGLMLVTGHRQAPRDSREPGQAGTDWPALAAHAHASKLTLGIYMGTARMQEIAAGLRQGLPASTPVAWVQSAGHPDERRAVGRLGDLEGLTRRHGIASPALLLVGDVLMPALAQAEAGESQAAPDGLLARVA